VKVKEVLEFLDNLSPFELQESWDNSGLNIGDLEAEISQIIVALEIDENLIKNAKEGSLFIVHHPLIFSKLKELNFAKYPSNLIKLIIKKDISLIAMHTNFDKTHLNRYVFENVLKFKINKERDFILSTNQNFSDKELFLKIKEAFGLKYLKVVNKKEKINGVALTTGSGASLLDFIDVDCFLTGDIKYHDAIKALSEDKMLIDIGHYESEKFFAEALQNSIKSLPISVIIAQSVNPFKIYTL
jgi:dinuclear metal center YbgI/SA1388 family protein